MILPTLRSHSRRLYELGRAEPVILCVFILFIAAVWIFLSVVSVVRGGGAHDIDRMILLSLRQPDDLATPIGPRWLPEMMRDITALGGVAVTTLVAILATGYFIILKKFRTAVYFFSAVVTGNILAELLKVGFDRPRPDLVPHETMVYTSSFPSAHSLMSALVYLTLGAMLARIQPKRRLKAYILAACVAITLLVGISRIYLGVHWPTDVLGGWMAGSAVALAFWLAARFLELRNRVSAS